MKIYVWRCEVCQKKGATVLEPLPNAIHLPCGYPLVIEVFSDIFLEWTRPGGGYFESDSS